MGIVDGLAKEVEQIKSDGRVDPHEVLGLFDNMMTMVTLLVEAKLPNKRRSASAIADKVAMDLMTERMLED
jgi:hypothetical protein